MWTAGYAPPANEVEDLSWVGFVDKLQSTSHHSQAFEQTQLGQVSQLVPRGVLDVT